MRNSCTKIGLMMPSWNGLTSIHWCVNFVGFSISTGPILKRDITRPMKMHRRPVSNVLTAWKLIVRRTFEWALKPLDLAIEMSKPKPRRTVRRKQWKYHLKARVHWLTQEYQHPQQMKMLFYWKRCWRNSQVHQRINIKRKKKMAM